MIKLVIKRSSFYKAFHSLIPVTTEGSWCILLGSILIAVEWKKWNITKEVWR